MREHLTDTIWIKRQKTDSEFPDFLLSRFHLFRHRPDLQLKLFACVLGVQHARTQDKYLCREHAATVPASSGALRAPDPSA
jgi:hypothetical protein